MLVSGVQQSDPVTRCMHGYLLKSLFPCWSLQNTESSLLGYPVGPHQLSASYIAVRMHWPQTPDVPSPPLKGVVLSVCSSVAGLWFLKVQHFYLCEDVCCSGFPPVRCPFGLNSCPAGLCPSLACAVSWSGMSCGQCLAIPWTSDGQHG